MPATEQDRALLGRVQAVLAPIPWVVIAVGLVVNHFVPMGTGLRTIALLIVLTVFFVSVLGRLACVAIATAGRRVPMLVLMFAVVTWAMGSISVNSSGGVGGAEEFPASGEWLFLVSYLGLVGFLLLDLERRASRPARVWLDLVIICGGIVCLASLLLVTPLLSVSGQERTSLLLAFTYPLADVILALVVLGQAILQLRTDRITSAMLGVSFLLLAGADSAFAAVVSATTYDFGSVSYALWGAAFTLLTAAACRPLQSTIHAVPRSGGTVGLVGAGLLALLVLLVPTDATLAVFVKPPAVLTLAAASARLALALRDANRANEAFALSQTDDLTQLPNRRAVRAWLSEGLAERAPMALMLLDLDGFKEINDALGHTVGDTVLKMVAIRMREAVGGRARIARMGGDEFAIVLTNTNEIELVETARGVLVELAKPIVIEGIEISPSGSIGVTVAAATDTGDGEVLRRADVAMYQAKSSGLGVALYDGELDEFSRSRLQMAEDLRRAFADGQIEVWYQPQVEIASMTVSGLEALVRWQHPLEGLISPVSFLPAARRAGLMAQLSQIVCDRAVEDLAGFLRDGLDVRVAINCAPPELLGPTVLPSLYAAIERAALPPDSLVLEVTEDSFLVDPERTREVLTELRGHQVQISIDDYGTGFSSLTYLRNLPVQELKIDRTLIGNVAQDERSRMIVASTIGLAHALDLRIVAEGVEDVADLDALVAMEVDTVQGYHFARPMPAWQIAAWMTTWTDQHPRGN
ncbi:putative bifunctional diguanylate cyclase/phosphodiesterase [Aeromicrobium sp. CF3.5]|uniref:putative bifunctional diguanylate cyclase/phosphodiesterase n=1 Tax=Aeromicrobium sp. CF3.5 TaxID=3373078 RepID=UPI003EE7C82E